MAESALNGLHQLVPLNQVYVHQKVTYVTGNKYVVMGPTNEVILYAKENMNAFGKIFGGSNREFYIDLFDTQHRELIKLRRPYTFGPDKMEVTVEGVLASVVRQEVTVFKPVLSINDAEDRPVFRVKGPALTSGECDYDIFTRDKKKVAVITKKLGGLRDAFTNADNFHIQFPKDLDVRYKAAIIGTCFLIDFLYYEN